MKTFEILLILMVMTSSLVIGQSKANPANYGEAMKGTDMKTYLIEREIPKAGELTDKELKGIAQKSNEVLKEMGPEIEWLHSYVTDDKVYCVYRARNEEAIRTHAEKGGFPVSDIQELSTKIDPSTANN